MSIYFFFLEGLEILTVTVFRILVEPIFLSVTLCFFIFMIIFLPNTNSHYPNVENHKL